MPPPRESLDTRRADAPGRTLLRLLGELRGRRLDFLLLFPAQVVVTAAGLAWPRALGLATDAIVGRGDNPVPWGRVAWLLALGLAATGVGTIAGLVAGRGTARLSAFGTSRLRRRLFSAVLRLPLLRLGDTRRGELLSRLAGDAASAGETLGQGLLQFFASAVSLLLTLAFMLRLSVPLALAACTVLPVSCFAGRALARVSRRLFRARQAALGRLNALAEEGISARREVKAFCMEHSRAEMFDAEAARLRSLAFRAEAVGGCTGPLMNALGNVSYLMVAAFGGFLALRGAATPGLVISFLLYARQFARPVNELAAQFGQLQSAIAGAERVYRLADEPPERDDGRERLDRDAVRGEILFDSVSFRYGDGPPVIHNVSLSIPAGATVALVGETGSGKTTLSAMIPRFHDPEGGRVLLDGRDLRQWRLEDLRKAVAVVPQDVRLFSGTVAENIAAGAPDASPERIQEALELAGADSFVRRLPLGVATPVGPGGASLSHGQRQLLALARAAVAKPRVLVLDEATSAVDPLAERRIRDALARLFRGRTCIVVAHRLSTVRGADKIVVLDSGRIVGEGPHSELLRTCSRYQALCRAAALVVPLVASALLFAAPPASAATHRQLPADTEMQAWFRLSVGSLPRTARALPWTVENTGDTELENLELRLVAPWDGATTAATNLPVLAPGASASGALDFPAPPLPGPHALALCAEASDPDGTKMRAWAQSRAWGPEVSDPDGAAVPHRLFDAQLESVGGTGAVLRVESLCERPLPLTCLVCAPSGFRAAGSPHAVFSSALLARETFETNLPVSRVSPHQLQGLLRVAVQADDGAVAWTENVRAALRAPRDDSAFPPEIPRLPAAVPVVLAAFASVAAVRRRLVLRHGGGLTRGPTCGASSSRWSGLATAFAASAILAAMLRLDLAVLGGGTAVAGDLAAHHVLVDRIARSWRVFGRCGAWWGTFPAFRFYFPLPYIGAAAASKLIGHNAAFNLAVALPAVLLPLTAWLGARAARLRAPAPAFLAAAMLPLALDNGNTMWGGNAYSALSGMFASAWGFALLPLALGLGARDAARGRFSFVSVLVFSALVLSHFFSALLCAASLGVLVLALTATGRYRAAAKLTLEGACSAVLCSPWLVPLVAWRGWSVDFGTQWKINLLRQLSPALAPAACGAALVALAISFGLAPRRIRPRHTAFVPFVAELAALGVAAAVLFFFGRALSDVFVNCRLWPFAEFAALSLCALAWSRLAASAHAGSCGNAAFLAAALALSWHVGGKPENPRWAKECLVPAWSQSAWSGFENLPETGNFREITELVADSRGAIAWDRHPGNAALGSMRVFEALPFLVPGLRTLEGGLVNGAIGAIPAHSVQFEFSRHPGGWPLHVRPRRFNPGAALPHLEALGVRTLIARHPHLIAALEDSAWRKLGETGSWKVYASALNDPGLVRVVDALPAPPIADGKNPQLAVAQWWADPANPQSGADGRWLGDATLDIDSGELRFTTDAPGKWHVTTLSVGPDWTATGVSEGPVQLANGQVAVRPDATGVVTLRPRSALRAVGL